MVHVLVVDDEEIMRVMLKQVLENNGYCVTVSHSGEDAIVLLQRKKFDIVITDLQMGWVSGLEVAQTAKNSPEEIKIFMITGCPDQKYETIARRIGVDEYLQKPFSIDGLLGSIKSHLNFHTVSKDGYFCAAQ